MATRHKGSDESLSGSLVFVGRNGVLDRLQSALDMSRSSRPVIVEVIGEPGMGKTRLLREFADRICTSGFDPVHAANGHISHFMVTRMSTLRRGDGASGRRAAGATGSSQTSTTDSTESSQHPILLIDDLHSADDESLRHFGQLLNAPRRGLVVATYRPGHLSQPMLTALANAHLSRDSIQLAPLDAAAVAALMGISPASAVRVHELSGGNPLYAQAYRYSDSVEDASDIHEVLPRLPTNVVEHLQSELAELPEPERRLVETVAILTSELITDLASTVAGLTPRDCADLLDRLVARDILRPATDGVGLRFRHEILRAVVYQSIPPGRRRHLHAAAAAAATALGIPPTLYAEHVVRSARRGNVPAVRILLRAAEDSLTPPETIVRWLSTAYSLLPDEGLLGHLRLDAELSLVKALFAAGRLHEGRRRLQAMADRAAQSPTWRLQTVLTRCSVERVFGRPEEAGRLVRDELLLFSARQGPVPALLAAEAAVDASLCGSPEAADYAALARRMAESTTDGAAKVRVAVVEAFTGAFAGDDAGLATLDRAAALVDVIPERGLIRDLDTLTLLAWSALLYERDSDALRYFNRALDLAMASKQRPLQPYLLTGRCFVALRQGHLDQAERDASEAERQALSMEFDTLATLTRTLRAASVAWRLGPEAARPLADAVHLDSTMQPRDWFGSFNARESIRLGYEGGTPADAVPALLRACGDATLNRVDACSRPYWATVVADMHRQAERPDEAHWWVEQADSLAQKLGLRGQAGHVAIARARLALDVGDSSAISLAQGAVDAFSELGWRLNEGAGRLLYARALSGIHEWRAAEAEVAVVRRIADVTGSQVLRRSAVGEQRRIVGHAGRSIKPAASAHAELSLTRREWQIVRLIAAGVSNAEAASQLYVTAKTIEAHLTRIFRKAGVTSRLNLVTMLAESSVNDDIV